MKKFLHPAALLFAVLGLLALGLLLDHTIRNYLVMPSFLRLEQQMAHEDITRCVEAIKRETFHLGQLATDWAQWDDTYEYVQDGNAAYEESNIQESLLDSGIHLIFIISGEGRIVLDRIFDPDTADIVSLPELAAGLPAADHPFVRFAREKTSEITGIMLSSRGPMFIAVRQILTSEKTGPARGLLVMGRFFNEETSSELNQQTQVNFSIFTRDASTLSAEQRNYFHSGSAAPVIDSLKDPANLHAFAVLADLEQQPALLIEAVLPREIMARGRETARFISITILGAALLLWAAAAVLFFFYRLKVKAHRRHIEMLVEERTAELSASDARLKALTEAASEGILILEDGFCLASNRRAGEMFGSADSAILGKKLTELIVSEQRDYVHSMISIAREQSYEATGIRQDGTTFPLAIHSSSVSYEGRTVRAVALQDLTEKKQQEAERQKLKKRLERSEKMESIGLMAGGVAHDLNNILSGVVTYPELILLNLPQDSKIRGPLEAIHKAGKRAAEVVADLLTVARGIAMVMEPVDLSSIVRDYLDTPEFNSLKRHHPHVSIRTGLSPEIPTVLGSRVHIGKCVMNLVTNGAEAIDGAGDIIIKTEVEHLDADRASGHGLAAGNYVVLSVHDNGPGISPEDLAHIFEPFYSRKIAGRSGTGLGLAVVWNTMQDHKGTVLVSSSSKGSVFRMFFAASALKRQNPKDEQLLAEIAGSGETVLVVDDDPQQLEIAEQLLLALNYTPLTAGSGEAALTILRHQPVHLVILDMIMNTGMNGLATFAAILEQNPRQKAVIASGFSEGIDVMEARRLGAGTFVRKPYSVGQIGTAIKQVLAENQQ